MHYIIAHDLGTSGNKATLYDESGALVASSTTGYSTRTIQTEFVEQDPGEWWRAVVQSTRDLLASSGVVASQIACVTFSGQMMGCLPVDGKGNPLRPSIIWADMRSEPQAKRLAKAVPVEKFYRITGHRPVSSYSLTKLMWVRDNEPDVYRRTAKTLQAKDFVVAKLTGVFATDYSDASGTNAFDLVKKEWSKDILDAVGVRASLFPDAYPSSAVVGRVTAGAARTTGLLEGTPVVIGGGDGSCAAVGAGVVGEGKAYNVLGSSSWVSFASSQPVFDPEMRTFNWVHLDDRLYTPCGTMQAAGLSIEWLRQSLGEYELYMERTAGESSIAAMNEAALQAPRGSNGLVYLPYLLGERSPRWDPSARGAIIGLSSIHRKSDIYRCVFEGVAFNLKTIIASLEASSTIGEIILIGGGAKSQIWRQILAEVWDKPVVIPQYLDEATSLGAAIAGGVGVKMFADFSVAERFNPVRTRIDPDPEGAAVYRRLYPLFEESYAALKGVFVGLVGFAAGGKTYA
jgi:xylulokinase